MKITRTELKNMISETLFHMGAQSQQLHDMIQPDDGLAPEILDNIKQSADLLEKAFKALTYDKQNPKGR